MASFSLVSNVINITVITVHCMFYIVIWLLILYGRKCLRKTQVSSFTCPV